MKLIKIALVFFLACSFIGPTLSSVADDTETVIINSARVFAAAMPAVKHALKQLLPELTAPNPNATNFLDKLQHAVLHESEYSPAYALWNGAPETAQSAGRIVGSAFSDPQPLADDLTPEQMKELTFCFSMARKRQMEPTERCAILNHKRPFLLLPFKDEPFPDFRKMRLKYMEMLRNETIPWETESDITTDTKSSIGKLIALTTIPTTTTLSSQEVIQRLDKDFAAECFLDRFDDLPVDASCLNLTHLPTASASEQENRRHLKYFSLVKKACRRGRGNVDKQICIDYYSELASDCFYNKVNSSFCKNIAKGPPVRNTSDRKFDGKLHDIYKKVVANFRRTQVQVIECFQDYGNRKVEKCRGLTWNDTSMDTSRNLAIYGFRQQLLKLEPSTNSTTEESQKV